MDPTQRSLLANILAQESEMPVREIATGEKLLPEVIYVVPPGHDCTVQDGNLRLIDLPLKLAPRHSIDVLFASLADAYGEHCAGIVLSGTGSDGVHGMLAIKKAVGITIAQDPATAEYQGMPQSVIEADFADLILSPERIGRALQDTTSDSKSLTVVDANKKPKRDLDGLLAVLSHKSKCEFGQYKESTLTRRIGRRMTVHGLKSLEAYTELVSKSDTESNLLFKDILISVTAFFRDDETFKVIRQVVRKILDRKRDLEAVRIWVAGCATGEEAYSIAILLNEVLSQKSLSTPIQIFATDIDTGAITFARRGVYPESSIKSVPSRLLKKYFVNTGGMYQISNSIRNMVIFARHDLIQDPPYINLDLVSCRNVLIYFRRPLQDKLIPLFHYSLLAGGYLVLGQAESVGDFTDLFTPLEQQGKVFGKKEGDARKLPALLRSQNFSSPRAELFQPQPRKERSLQEQYRDLVAQAYAPTGVLVNDRFEVVHVQGEVTQFIRLPAGDLSVNIMDIVIAPLSIETRLVLQKAQRERIVVRGRPIELKNQYNISRVTLIAIPSTLESNGGEGILLLFEVFSAPIPAKLAKRPEADIDGLRINELEQELVATREQLQTSVEDLQSANENLQSVNEEYQSTAEELQSANEELQTTNEELQSSNEELRTLNDELTLTTGELKSTNRDLEIILNTVLSGIVVLDRDGTVR